MMFAMYLFEFAAHAFPNFSRTLRRARSNILPEPRGSFAKGCAGPAHVPCCKIACSRGYAFAKVG